MSMDISQRIQAGLQHHQAGRFGEADAIYRSVLSENPNHPEILYLMSVLSLQVGRFENAANFIEQAIKVKADEPNYHNIAGEARLALGDVESAIAAYKQAIALNPEPADDAIRTLPCVGCAQVLRFLCGVLEAGLLRPGIGAAATRKSARRLRIARGKCKVTISPLLT